MKKPVVYTSIFGKVSKLGLVYQLHEPVCPDPKCEYVCFTDHKDFSSKVWNIMVEEASGDQRLNAKKFKMLPHKYFDAEVTMWVDGAITITSEDIHKFIEQFVGEAKFRMFLNPFKNSVGEYIEDLIESGRIDAETVHKQYRAYLEAGFPNGIKPIRGGVLLRRSLDSEVIKFNEEWWEHNLKYCSWDEVSFPFVAWKMGWMSGREYEPFPMNMYENSHFHVPQL